MCEAPDTVRGTLEKKCLLYFSLLLDFGIQIHLMVPTVLMA